jgi:hypothetical protein
VVGGAHVEPFFVQADTSAFDVIDQQVEYRDGFEFIQGFGKPFLQTIPGRQIGVPSFGPQQRIDLQSAHVFHDAAGHGFHGFIVTGEISPVGALPVVRSHGPVFTGGMEDSTTV